MAQRPFSTLQGHTGYCHGRQFGIRVREQQSEKKTDKQTTGSFLEMETRQKPISLQTSETQAKRTNYED